MRSNARICVLRVVEGGMFELLLLKASCQSCLIDRLQAPFGEMNVARHDPALLAMMPRCVGSPTVWTGPGSSQPPTFLTVDTQPVWRQRSRVGHPLVGVGQWAVLLSTDQKSWRVRALQLA